MSGYIKLVEDTINALRVLSEHEEGVGVREISRLLGINKSTCHRMLLTLEKENIVDFNELTQKYYMSLGVLQLANKTIQSSDLLSIALPHMYHLREVTSETIGLHMRVMNYRLVIGKIESNHDLRWSPLIGKPYPLYLGAASKTFCAFMSKEMFQEILDQLPGNMNRQDFVMEIEKVREQQFAISRGEIEQGGMGAAAPIFDKGGNLRSVISIYGLANRVDEKKLEFFIQEVCKTAKKISESMMF